jgi:hypothetical protein
MIFLDNSRLKTFKECPRKYVLTYIRGWSKKGTKPALLFGDAWHAGLEALYKLHKTGERDSDKLELHAKAGFMARWSETTGHLIEEELATFGLRTASQAMQMYRQYCFTNKEWFKTIEVLAVEDPFLVEVTGLKVKEPVYIVGRIDAVIRDDLGVWALEHKTTSLAKAIKEGSKTTGHGFQWKFMTMFNPNSQVDTYSYALRTIFTNEDVRGALIDGALVHKTTCNCTKIPIMKTEDDLVSWFLDARQWIAQLLETRNASYVKKNTESCQTTYGECAYADICRMVPNPLEIDGLPSAEFEHDIWEPFDFDEMERILAQ